MPLLPSELSSFLISCLFSFFLRWESIPCWLLAVVLAFKLYVFIFAWFSRTYLLFVSPGRAKANGQLGVFLKGVLLGWFKGQQLETKRKPPVLRVPLLRDTSQLKGYSKGHVFQPQFSMAIREILLSWGR